MDMEDQDHSGRCMKVCVWKTGHEIADTVAEAVVQCFRTEKRGNNLVHSFGPSIADCAELHHTDEIINGLPNADVHIGYGVLRGMDEVFRACDKAGKPWFNIDKGYWKSGHYDGYYRISLRGTQQTFGLDKLKPDYERWDKLGLEIFPQVKRESYSLICPPTQAVDAFFEVDKNSDDCWIHDSYRHATGNFKVRTKEAANVRQRDNNNLQHKLDECHKVITFNSSVGWEALRQGIPVVSDPDHSIVGAYQKMLDIDLSKDSNERRKFFAIQCGLQLTLDEIRSGKLWPLLQTLLTIN